MWAAGLKLMWAPLQMHLQELNTRQELAQQRRP